MAWTTFHQILTCGTGCPLICRAWGICGHFHSDMCWPAQLVLDHNWIHSARRCFPQSVASTGWIRSQRSMSSSKTRSKALDISSLEFNLLLRSSIYPPIAIHVSHNGCRHFKTKLSTANKLYICQQTDHLLSLSTNIICRCQQTVQLPPVPKAIHSNKPSLQKRPWHGQEMYQRKLYTNYVFCVVYCVLCITVLCCANNQMQIFSTKLLFFS